MNKNIELYNNVVKKDYCVGCGACAGIEGSPFTMVMDKNGQYKALLDQDMNSEDAVDVSCVCPFMLNDDETVIGRKLYGGIPGIIHDKHIGYYLKNYAGFVISGDYREKGSSGGFGTWLLSKLLEEDMVDFVVHVKESDRDDLFFEYAISSTQEGLREGAKSKYYPVELSQVLEAIKNQNGRYVVVGVPCFIKSIRLATDKDPVLNERIKHTIGIVCGHLKSDRFAKAMAWEMGIKPSELSNIDFRVKLPDRGASEYGVKATGLVDGETTEVTTPVRDLYTSNWGYGYFKLNACDYCDDVLAETADIAIGDAWLPRYVKDSTGTNIVIIRSQDVLEMLHRNIEELYLDDLSVEEICLAQAGGFRHRKEGLAYRLHLKEQEGQWVPKKRVESRNLEDAKRKQVYKLRMDLFKESFNAYDKAIAEKDFAYFKKHIESIRLNYERLRRKPFMVRVVGKAIRIFKKVLMID